MIMRRPEVISREHSLIIGWGEKRHIAYKEGVGSNILQLLSMKHCGMTQLLKKINTVKSLISGFEPFALTVFQFYVRYSLALHTKLVDATLHTRENKEV